MTQKFPRMTATIVEVVDGFTVTIWFRHAAGLGNAALLKTNPSARSKRLAQLFGAMHRIGTSVLKT